jgi:glycosyltransferase involved in cell wall biosynthesis
MYAGAHGLANRLEVVLEAAHRLEREGWGERIRFRLVGDGPEKPALVARTRLLGLKSVIFEDPVTKYDIYRTLQEADAFLMMLAYSPVFQWGVSPNKLFDFMAAARPVLFGVKTAFNPVQEAEAGITVPPEDSEALANAIKHLAEMSPEQRWAMGLRGRRYVEEHHAFARLGGRLEEVLAQVVQNRTYCCRPEAGATGLGR